LVADFVAMLLLLSMQQAVSAAYRVFVALPLVFVSIEPLIWPRPSHAIPKEHYYTLRVVEFLALWGGLVSWGDDSLVMYRSTAHLSLASTVCLYILLPCVWRMARERELGAMAQADQADSDEEAEALSPHHRDPLERHAVPHDDEFDEDEDEERELTERLL
jgi:hypothetical protein